MDTMTFTRINNTTSIRNIKICSIFSALIHFRDFGLRMISWESVSNTKYWMNTKNHKICHNSVSISKFQLEKNVNEFILLIYWCNTSFDDWYDHIWMKFPFRAIQLCVKYNNVHNIPLPALVSNHIIILSISFYTKCDCRQP